MAKRITKTFHEKFRDAKSFHELIDLLEANEREALQGLQIDLKKRDRRSLSLRPIVTQKIRKHEVCLASLNKRRDRFDAIYGNRKIPATLRKKVTELETEIIRLEYEGDGSMLKAAVRNWKRNLDKLLEEVDQHLNPSKVTQTKSLETQNPVFKVGNEYTHQSLTRTYDAQVWEVLEGHFEIVPKLKGTRAKIKIRACLPLKAEYLQLKEVHFTKSLEATVAEAYDKVDVLQSEMQDAFDSTPENLQYSHVGEARLEAASQLQDIAENVPSVPESVGSVQVLYYPSIQQSSRVGRADDAAATLRAVLLAVQIYIESAKLKKAELKEIQEFCDQLEADIAEIEEVEFPGMFR